MANIHSVSRNKHSIKTASGRLRLSPLVEAVAFAVIGLASVPAVAQSATQIGSAWMAHPQSVGAARAARSGVQVDVDAGIEAAKLRQQQASRQALQKSVVNLERTAAAIAAQQAAQKAARDAAHIASTHVPDGLVQGGLWDRDVNGSLLQWTGADRAVQTTADGNTTVAIKQTESKAVLNWDTFNIGRNTTVDFQQNSTDTVLNRVVGDSTAPSQILGTIQGDGTVMVINQNGVIFSGTSQVNVRNLVAAAATITDDQLTKNGLYVNTNGTSPTFTNALGAVVVEAGAQITTAEAKVSTADGGYVMLLGANVSNAGQITTPSGQTVLAAGDSFYIRKGVGTDANLYSTTSGNEVSTVRAADSTAGRVENTGLIIATTGDITLTGHEVVQNGVVVATTSSSKRGTIHISNRASDNTATVTLGGTTAVLLADTDATALDSQRDAGLEGLGVSPTNNATGVFDNLSTIADRTDLSRIEIVSGKTVEFQDDSMTLATGGEIVVAAAKRTLVNDGATLDVSGAIGVQVAMASNSITVQVQGNELRDAPVNRDSGGDSGSLLNSTTVWIDRRDLVYVPAGTNGYDSDRWYTKGGLLEVGGYLATSGHTVGEWMALGGTVTVTGGDLVTRAGSSINLSGGTLDVQSGNIKQTWLKGSDGRLYELSVAPGDLIYEGLYQGYELQSKRWGQTNTYYNPLIGSSLRYETGYTVGRDAGKLVVSTSNAVLEGGIVSDVYQGDYQTDAAQTGLDGYYQSQSAVARSGQLIVGTYNPIYDADNGLLRYTLSSMLNSVSLTEVEDSIAGGLQLADVVSENRQGRLVLDTDLLNDAGLSAIRIAANESISVDSAVEVFAGGEIVLYAPAVDVAADLTAHSGTIRLGNVLEQPYVTVSSTGTTYGLIDQSIAVPDATNGGVWVQEGVTLDATGLVSDQRGADAGNDSALAYVDGGTVSIRSTESITLASGSLIDVSSGAVVLADGSVAGGTGGNVQLGSGLVSTGAGNATAVLTLDGDIRGYGVNGGGTLEIESASAISIGGELLEREGILRAGESAQVDLVLLEDTAYEIKAGEAWPVDYFYKSKVVPAGSVVPSTVATVDDEGNYIWYTLKADWKPHQPNTSGASSSYYILTSDGTRYEVTYFNYARISIPEGTTVRFLNGSAMDTGWTVPKDVFPEGVFLASEAQVHVKAGTVANTDLAVSLLAGTTMRAGNVLNKDVLVAATTALSPDLFHSGFSNYSVRSHNGLVVADGTRLDVAMPVLQTDTAVLSAGGSLENLFQPVLPDLYRDDDEKRQVSQRAGASLSLAAGVAASVTGADGLPMAVGDSGNLYVGTGARVAVDPGQSITLSSRENLTIDGLLQAKGGRISLLGAMTASDATGSLEDGGGLADGTPNEQAIRLGAIAVLDASAASYVVTDRRGSPYGLLTGGGSIVIGGTVQESTSRVLASDAFVVIQEGARVDASGGLAVLDVNNTGTSATIVSDGGSISIASARGLYLGGNLRAEAGGAGASGGSLAVALEALNYLSRNVETTVLPLRELQLVQRREAGGADTDELVYGHAVLGVDQVDMGGFDSLTLYSNGAISFGSDVDLTLGRELRLYSGALAVANGVDPSIGVSLAAPYILLAGITDNGPSAEGYSRPSYQGGVSTLASSAVLTAMAKLLDVKGMVTSGLNTTVDSVQVERAGFGQLNLLSSGDIRFVDAEPMRNGGASYDAQLLSSGDILFRAAQIYPATGVRARVLAGRASDRAYHPEGLLVIERYDDGAEAPGVPYSVFGDLILGAANIVQNGVLRAPLGAITLGTASSGSGGNTGAVTLGAGSLTSVSAAGLVFPFGGTTDNVIWTYDGKAVSLVGVGNEPAITLSATDVAVEESAELDLSGGGELVGAGFVSGRGGSADARYNALVQVGGDSFTLPSLDTNPVYAIVPGYASVYAPADSTGAVDPLIGQQVTIAAGDIPGLAAGTYTLLPSTYALLPGAFRVEINGGATGTRATAVAMRNGSYAVSGMLSTANTGIHSSLASELIITPADVLRSYSKYNETSYAAFVANQAELNGTVRAVLPTDAGTLAIRLPSSSQSSFSFQGLADFTPAKDGHGGTATLVSSDINYNNAAIEILASGAMPTEGFSGASVYADDLNAIGAARLTIGGVLTSVYGESLATGANVSNYVNVSTEIGTGSLVLREGAVLRAPEVFLIASNLTNGIDIEAGAGINTIGMGKAAYDSTDGYYYRPGDRAVVAVSNGWINMLAPVAATGTRNNGAGPITIGVCGFTCNDVTELYSEGTILAATLADFELSGSVRYGTRNLVLAVGTVNAGSNEDLAAAAARGALTSGLTLNQSLLDRLLQGDTAYGAPALERLVLTAGESFNFFGNVSLDTTDSATGEYRLNNLVLSTPAIYGYGEVGDEALIKTAKLTWAGLEGDAPAPVLGGRGTGSGRLEVHADVIEFGYDASAQPNGIDDPVRTILGFTDVLFDASDRITANKKGALSVYQSQAVDGDGVLLFGEEGAPVYQGGNLILRAPLVTGQGGSVNRITAGGMLQVLAPESGAASAESVTLDQNVATGAELNLAASSIVIDTTVALPSGKLTATADGDITLADKAYLDLSGRAIQMFDVTSYSWGGDVILRSTSGNILQSAGSTLDVSAEHNHAGLITATALDEGAGIVNLLGTLLGSASGHYDAGGTDVPYRAGGVNISAQSLGTSGTLTEQFAALNTRLNDGGFVGERSFHLKGESGLMIGDELKASEINISLDNGHLIVAGMIDASGERVGSIRLVAGRGLTLASGAVLDAHGRVLRVDSYGQIIDSPNRAIVELDAGTGQLTLADGVRIDLRHGTESGGGDGKNRGTLDLYAARVGSSGNVHDADAATHGDIAIDARGSVTVQGARSIAVYGRQVYADARYNDASKGETSVSGRPYQIIDQVYLKAKHDQAVTFMNTVLGNDDLLKTRLAGLNNDAYRDAFHLRPAVEIVSATPDGDLIVSGDLDLSGYRYASLNPNTQKSSVDGSGEVGQLTMRAGGDLSIYGSINDGFAPPPETPDDEGWLLTPGVQAFGGDVVVPVPGVTLGEGTKYPKGKTLNYDITASNVTLPSGTTLPSAVTLDRAVTLPPGTVLAADVVAADGTVFPAGSVVGAEGLVLTSGAQLMAGTRLPVAMTVASLTWPKGVALPVAMTQQGSKTLPVGALITSGTDVVLPDDVAFYDLRSTDADGNYIARSNWAVAKMLPTGSQSWSMRLVAGADTTAADSRLTRLDGGKLVFADTHYVIKTTSSGGTVGGLNATGAATLVSMFGLPPGVGSASELVGKTEEEVIALYGAYTWDDFGLPGFWDPSAGNIQTAAAGLNLQGANSLVSMFGLPPGVGSSSELVGKTEEDVIALYGAYTWDDFGLPGFWDASAGNIQTAEAGLTLKGANSLVDMFGLPPGTGSISELVGKTEQDVISLYGAYTWDDFGLPGFWDAASGNSVVSQEPTVTVDVMGPSFSVVRTGKGDLDIVAAGDLAIQSAYGIYTAGTQTSLGSAALDAAYNQGRSGLMTDGTVLDGRAGEQVAEYEALVSGNDSLYQAWYPDGGGNLWVSAGGNLTGDSWSSSFAYGAASASVGNWLWRQGTGNTSGVDDVPTAWWINFGTYTYDFADADQSNTYGYWPIMTGFTGLGTLGGGNATVRVGGDAGVVEARSINAAEVVTLSRSEGLALAVGGTGRVLNDGSLVLTGGGDLDLRIGGGWNSHADARLLTSGNNTAQTHELYGALVNLRGAITMQAGQIGTVELFYGALQDAKEIRATDPYTSSLSLGTGGLMLVAGDSTATIASRSDLVLGGVADAGLVDTDHYVAYRGDGGSGEVGTTWFSLWTDRTTLDLLSAGGNLAFVTQPSETMAGYNNLRWDYISNGGWFLLPGNMRAAAITGSIYYGTSAAYLNTSGGATNWNTGGLLLAPLGKGTIELLAGDSIYGGGYGISNSGGDASSIATVFNPAFAGYGSSGNLLASNVSDYAPIADIGYNPLFAFGVNSMGSELGVTNDDETSPSRFYAVGGDIVGLRTGTEVQFGMTGSRANQTDYVANGPVAIRAGADIVNLGGGAVASGFANDFSSATLSSNLIIHTNPNDVSVIEAGRNILYANFDIAGPGTLEISAAGNIMQNDLASLTSIGPVVAGDSRPGANIVVQAGATASKTNYAGFLAQYLNAENLADSEQALADQEGKVVKTYETELVEWLADRYGFMGTVDEALAYFGTLAPEQQRIFARQVYFAELRAAGREYNDANGPRTGSYLRGRNAIAELFPNEDGDGKTIAYSGNLLMYGASGIHTNLGGDIQVVTPGGSQTYGVEGAQPPSTAGLITRGQGNIQLYSRDSILLGQSRIMTTFGGGILAWSAEGDINAGRGSNTTVVYTPPRRVYDNVGNVTISPDVPSTGAGIATLNPIPEVEPGDVDLIAPLGTIDAGEAGIRVSGNVNIAALQVVNAANIQVQGDSAGIPVIAAVNVGALTSASAAASTATQAAQDVVRQQQAAARQNQRSMVSVQILGFGSETL